MKNRFCKMGQTLLGAVCLLSTCGLTYSCSDDYDLPDTQPDFLRGSIYDELKARENFTTTIKLIDDLDYAEVLSKTGSKTLFVASDEAYAKFFANTNWTDGAGNPIRDYKQLSTNQKRVLLYNSMLDNAYVMEMLANTSGGGKNNCLRQVSSASAADSVPYWPYSTLPTNNNVDAEGIEHEIKFWSNYNVQSRGGIYMALDNTRPMMTHFLEGPMRERNITNEDVSFILGYKEGDAKYWSNDAGTRSYIYGAQVTEQDVTCLNGYFHVMDTVLITPPNMAEAIRQDSETQLFSHMLDRFSAPFYDPDLTAQYQALHPSANIDSVFQKRYFATRSQGGNALSTRPDGEALRTDFPYLSFDPGWNEYATSDTEAKETDMGVIFAPSDDAIKDYFLRGQGSTLMDRYATQTPVNEDNLEYNLDQIPLDILKSLINNFLKASFNESVPSKYRSIMNDARDPMFQNYNEQAYRNLIKKTLLANNGVVYVINQVIAPADYAAVSAPVLMLENAQVMKAVITADDNYISGDSYNNAPLQKYYSTYLKAMQSHFSLFVPEDEGFRDYGYVDPRSSASNPTSQTTRAFTFQYERVSNAATGKYLPILSTLYYYNESDGIDLGSEFAGGSEANDPVGSSNTQGAVKASLLTQMVDQHIVVQDSKYVIGQNDNEPRYYLSRSGAPVYIKTTSEDPVGKGMEVEGGFQVYLRENNRGAYAASNVIDGYNMTGGTGDDAYGNGMTYIIDRPMQPVMKSVYNRMSNNENFKDFFDLCNGWDEDLLAACGFRLLNQDEPKDVMSDIDWRAERNKYRIFIGTETWNVGTPPNTQTVSNGYYPATGEALVRFFNNYNYTIYVPTNAKVQEAIASGIPTWESIQEFVDSKEKFTADDGSDLEGILKNKEDREEAQSMVILLVNFLKYHFQDKSIFVDNVSSFKNESGTYQTSCIDNEDNVYLSLGVTQNNGSLQIQGRSGNPVSVSATNYNVLASDHNFSREVIASNTTIKTSSYVVLHQIDGYLDFRSSEEAGTSFASAYSTPAKAKAFAKRYRIRK